MKTLTLTIDDETYAHIESDARIHLRTIEDEVVARCKPVDWSKRPLITDRDELMREIDAFQKELADRGICLSDADVREAIKEGRE